MERILQWDQEILIYLNNLGSKPFDTFWLFVTNQSNWIPLFILIALSFIYFLGWRKGLLALVILSIALGICNETTDFFKAYFDRLRPTQNILLEGKIRDLLHPHNRSFISGHSSNSTLLVWFSIWLLRSYTRWVYVLVVWWLLFMYSRIYTGVHYPFDILAGISWGILIYFLARWIYLKSAQRIIKE